MEQFEIKLTREVPIPEAIETNIKELDAIIKGKEELAKSLVVTDDLTQVDLADKDAAEIVKMAKSVARFRIDFIKRWKSPVDNLEKTCKEYEKRLEAAAATLRTKTAEVKSGWKLKRREKLHGIWLELIAGYGFDDSITSSGHFESFFELWTAETTTGNWLNKTVTDERASANMKAELDRIAQAVKTVRENYATDTAEVRAKADMVMVEHFDVSEVIAAVNAFEKEQAEIAARKAEEEAKAKAEAEAKARAEEEAKARLAAKREAEAKARAKAEVKPAEAVAESPAEAVAASPAPSVEKAPTAQAQISAERRYCVTLRISGPCHDFQKLHTFLATTSLKSEKIGETIQL